MFSIVAAIDARRGIGKDGSLPWPKLKGDMRFYRELTTGHDTSVVHYRFGLTDDSPTRHFKSYNELLGYLKTMNDIPTSHPNRLNAVIMGRNTWASLPDRFKPLPNRKNLVLSRTPSTLDLPQNVLIAGSLEQALTLLENYAIPNIFIIGGGDVFREAIQHPQCQHIYLTEISATLVCDTFFPYWNNRFQERFSGFAVTEHSFRYQFKLLERI